jgi:hypothetical protein
VRRRSHRWTDRPPHPANGAAIAGVPEPPPETEGEGELDGIGYADAVTVEGIVVPLSEVVEASVAHPHPASGA